ncbi:MAG: histidine phosphatase family protein [Proteobacteria bacterium]|nr:histidine phosphatase family protein [Pseudomonadota bacterium]
MELIIIRHGLPLRVETQDDSPADPDLSEEGKEQARKLARWMKSERLDVLYSSPMNRAKQTAEPMAGIIGLEILIESGVAEFDRNSSEYVPMEELKSKDYEKWLELMQGGFQDHFDLDAFQKTAVDTLEGIVTKNKGKRVAVVCHGGVINIWAAHVLGIDNALFFQPQYTSINRFLIASSGTRSVVSLNEAAHLRDDLVFG